MNQDRQIEIDRMVDGELDAAQQRAVLLRCEEQNSWRALALAYVESQTWGAEFKAIDRLPARVQASEKPAGERLSRKSRAWNSWALAASVLFALSVGYGLHWWWQADASPSSAAPLANVPADLTAKSGEQGAKIRSMYFTISNPLTNELQQIELPIVRASDLGPDWQEQIRPEVPAELLREMRAAGLKVRQTRTMTPVRLSDGTQVIVPIDYYFEQLYQ